MMRITLLTDFGTADGYVAAMKGAIAQIAPSVLIDDASHYIPHGDIVAAALTLRRYWKLYPSGTVHVVVVDPGVGTSRRAIMVASAGHFFVGPDNGVLSYVLDGADVFEAGATGADFADENGDYAISNTFHGRDVFAPLAAKLANGVAIEELGTPIQDPVRITLPTPMATADTVRGEIIHVDHFGNLISNIPAKLIQADHVAHIADRDLRIVRTYGDAEPGELVALINSDNVLEVAAPNSSAARMLNVARGEIVELHS